VVRPDAQLPAVGGDAVAQRVARVAAVGVSARRWSLPKEHDQVPTLTKSDRGAITAAYESIGREPGATVVPVGVAWERFLQKHDQPALHNRDGSHPTATGTCLAACSSRRCSADRRRGQRPPCRG
jgi:hypothetical protein